MGAAWRGLAAALGVLLGVLAVELAARAALAGSPAGPVSPLDDEDRANLRGWRERRSGIGLRPDLSGPVCHDPVLGWRNRPGLVDFVWEGRPPISTNTSGMRGALEYTKERSGPRRRVALVGDSFVFGLDQPDARIFAALLAEQLDAEVLNFGVPGYGTDQSYLMLVGEVLAWKPDDVVFGLFAENPKRAQRRFSFYAKPRFQLLDGSDGGLELEGVPVPTPEELVADSIPAERRPYTPAVVQLVRRWQARASDVGAEPPELLELHRRLLAAAQHGVAEVGARLTVLYIPGSGYATAQVGPVEASLPTWAEARGFALLNLREVFLAKERERGEERGAFYLPGRHFSPRGHQLVAEVLARHLAELGAGPVAATAPR